MTAAAKGVVGVRLAEEDSMGSALADDAMAFKAACTMAADAYELLLLPLSPIPAHQSSYSMVAFTICIASVGTFTAVCDTCASLVVCSQKCFFAYSGVRHLTMCVLLQSVACKATCDE